MNLFFNLLILLSFVASTSCMDQLKNSQEESINLKLSKVFEAFEAVKLPGNAKLTPHAILYDGGLTMDVFLTLPSGYLKFSNKIEDVPERSFALWKAKYPHVCHLGQTEPGEYKCEYVHFDDWCFLAPQVITKTWQYDGEPDIRTVFASEKSAILRLSMTRNFDQSEDILTTYIIDKLSAGFNIILPEDAVLEPWFVNKDIIPHVVKTQGHKFIRYNGYSSHLQLFKSAVEECRQERSSSHK